MRLLIILSLSLLYNCQSTPDATTARIQERSEYVATNLDNAANDCLTENCKRAMRDAKELIKDSLDVMIDKDYAIQVKQKQIDSEAFYTKIGRFVVWGFIAITIGILLYIFRDQILTIIKIAKPI
jgi:hypothetical protein